MPVQGFQRSLVLRGGLSAWRAAAAGGTLTAPDLRFIERDGLAVLLGVHHGGGGGAGGGGGGGGSLVAGAGTWGFQGNGRMGHQHHHHHHPVAPLVLDLRRADERALYGSIPGSKHLPGTCWWGHVALVHVALGHMALGHVPVGHVAAGHVALGHVATGHVVAMHVGSGTSQ